MSGSRRWLAALLGLVFLALTGRIDAQDPPGPAGSILARARVPVAQPEPATPMAIVPPGQVPPDPSDRVRVEVVDSQVVEGSPLQFRVIFPARFNAAGFDLTYVVEGARVDEDYRQPTGTIQFTEEPNVGSFEIATLPNPASGGATLHVVVRAGNKEVGSADGTIIDRTPPRVDVTSTPVREGGKLVFQVTIDPAAEFRGPWTYSWRVESVDAVDGASAVEGEDYQPGGGTLRFDADGRQLDPVEVVTLPNESAAGQRALRLIVSVGDVEYGSGLGMIEDLPVDESPPPTPSPPPPPPPSPPPGWDWTLIAIVGAVLVTMVIGIWWLRRPTPSPDVIDDVEPDAPQDPVPPEVAVETSSGPSMYEPTGLGLPELAIETKAGPAIFTPPARLPVEPVGE